MTITFGNSKRIVAGLGIAVAFGVLLYGQTTRIEEAAATSRTTTEVNHTTATLNTAHVKAMRAQRTA